MKDLHTVGRDRLKHGDAAGERRESRHEEKGQSDKASNAIHGFKHLGKGNKHQARACLHALDSFKNIDGRNDHHSREQSHSHIKAFNLMNRCNDIHILVDIGAIGDHDSHGHTEGKENLAHGVQQNLKEAGNSQSREVRHQINTKTLQTRPRNAFSVRALKGQGKNRNGNDHY